MVINYALLCEKYKALRIKRLAQGGNAKPKSQGKTFTTESLCGNGSNNVVYATRKGSDQPALTCSLIRAFASRLSIL